MTNKARGEVRVDLNGQSIDLCLNLGALAAVEAEFGVDSFEDVLGAEGRMTLYPGGSVSADRMARFLTAVVDANGYGDRSADVAALLPADLADMAMRLIAEAFPDPAPVKKKGQTRRR